VDEVDFAGFVLARKRTYVRRRVHFDVYKGESQLLAKLTEARMMHIVSFVGSYMIARRPSHEIGLLMWPVAPCDLQAFLHSLSAVVDASKQTIIDISGDIWDDLQLLSKVVGPEYMPVPTLDTAAITEQCQNLIQACLRYLQRSLGCSAKALAYLHQQKIRYNGVAPSKILLCSGGPYLCGFTAAFDFSLLDRSTTDNPPEGCRRYLSPEALDYWPRGRSHDVFSLGIVFLEIGQHLIMQRLHTSVRSFSEVSGLGWQFTYAEHLEEIDGWLDQFITAAATDIPMSDMSLKDAQSVGRGQPESLRALAKLIRQMLKHDPTERPSMQEVVDILSEAPVASQDASGVSNSFFGVCCMPKPTDS
jgi:serine/threonine protein kinase